MLLATKTVGVTGGAAGVGVGVVVGVGVGVVLGVADTVAARISRIATRIAQRQDEIFGRYGLTRGDVGVLSALRTSPPPHTLSPTQLFRGLMMSSAGMTKRLDRLEKVGLVKRNPDKDDRRGVTIHLTEPGRRLLARAV